MRRGEETFFDKQIVFIMALPFAHGFTLSDLIAEEGKANPDKAKIAELEKKFLAIGRERQEVYGGNDEMKCSVIKRYSEYIRERVANA
jgi:hypothetical protein